MSIVFKVLVVRYEKEYSLECQKDKKIINKEWQKL